MSIQTVCAFTLLATVLAGCATPAAESAPRLYRGGWFVIAYPGDFRVEERERSASLGPESDRYDGVAFVSPDGKVEFYVFSPQWGGTSEYETILPNEEVLEVDETGDLGQVEKGEEDRYVKSVLIADRSDRYFRTFRKTVEIAGSVSWLVGVKYRSPEDYERYREEYQAFTASLVQYAD